MSTQRIQKHAAKVLREAERNLKAREHDQAPKPRRKGKK